MRKKLKEALISNKKIIENFSYLTVFQIFTLVSPLIVYPYMISVVGLKQYGVIIFASTIVSYFSLLINFGFGTSAPKNVAILANNANDLSEYVSTVYIIKSFIWIICFIIYLAIILTFDFFKDNFLIYFISYFLTVNEVLFPVWFFQGIEKMKYITYINIAVKIFFIIAIFALVKEKSDYLFIPILNSIGALIGGLISFFIILKKEKIELVFVKKEKLIFQLKEDFSLFISTISIQIYMNLNKVIVGAFLGMKEVAIYDLGEKILSLMKTPLMMLSQAVFPKISRDKSIKYINGMMYLVTGTFIILYLVLFVTCPWIVAFFIGKQLPMAIDIVRILGISLIFLSLNMFLGGLRLIPFGLNKEYMIVMVGNGITYVVLISILWLLKTINIFSISIVYVTVEAFCFLFLLWMNKKHHLLTDIKK